jgi:hypothetical protein
MGAFATAQVNFFLDDVGSSLRRSDTSVTVRIFGPGIYYMPLVLRSAYSQERESFTFTTELLIYTRTASNILTTFSATFSTCIPRSSCY